VDDHTRGCDLEVSGLGGDHKAIIFGILRNSVVRGVTEAKVSNVRAVRIEIGQQAEVEEQGKT